MKIRLVGAELFHTKKTKVHDGANKRFSQFCKCAKGSKGVSSSRIQMVAEISLMI
jgi:hypothetical protein